tara:strand:+ start:180 stop:689 length:510 start_codon:yes stop_codon:yes gene_type:complete
MQLIYVGLFIPHRSMDQLMLPINSNIQDPHVTMRYYGNVAVNELTSTDKHKIGAYTQIQPWAMITSNDIDLIVCRKSHQGMSVIPHITLRVSNGAKAVDSNKFADGYEILFKNRVFDPQLNGPAQIDALNKFRELHPDARIFKYGSIAPIEVRWGAFTSNGEVIYDLPK